MNTYASAMPSPFSAYTTDFAAKSYKVQMKIIDRICWPAREGEHGDTDWLGICHGLKSEFNLNQLSHDEMDVIAGMYMWLGKVRRFDNNAHVALQKEGNPAAHSINTMLMAISEFGEIVCKKLRQIEWLMPGELDNPQFPEFRGLMDLVQAQLPEIQGMVRRTQNNTPSSEQPMSYVDCLAKAKKTAVEIREIIPAFRAYLNDLIPMILLHDCGEINGELKTEVDKMHGDEPHNAAQLEREVFCEALERSIRWRRVGFQKGDIVGVDKQRMEAPLDAAEEAVQSRLLQLYDLAESKEGKPWLLMKIFDKLQGQEHLLAYGVRGNSRERGVKIDRKEREVPLRPMRAMSLDYLMQNFHTVAQYVKPFRKIADSEADRILADHLEVKTRGQISALTAIAA